MKSKSPRLFLAALALALLPWLAGEARACTCSQSGPPCQDFWKADAVFAGTVVGVSGAEVDDGDYKRAVWLVRLTVEQALRGVEGPEVEVWTGRGGGDCGYNFKAGERYLVYAHRGQRDGRLSTGICSRTRLLSEADEDLAFVAGLATAAPTGSVSGKVFKQNYEWREGEPFYKPLAGVGVRVEGPGASHELKTDARGAFRAKGLAPGTYRLRLSLPPGLAHGGEAKRTVGGEVKVVARGCAEADFYVESDTNIGGRVVDALGQPAAKLPLQLRGAPSDQRNNNTFRFARTDAEGRFEFKVIPPGEYLLGLRILDASGENLPYPRTYYPGVTPKAGASVIRVGEGESVRDIEFRLPPPLAERGVEGFVVWEDGRPAPGANIYLSEFAEGEMVSLSSSRADEHGRFTLKVYEGLTYKMSAYQEGAGSPPPQSPWVEFQAAPRAPHLKLVLPAPKK